MAGLTATSKGAPEAVRGDIVAIGVGSRNDKGELLTRHEAVLVVALDLRKVVVASRNQDLHIADDGTNFHAVAPFLHHESHIVFALQRMHPNVTHP